MSNTLLSLAILGSVLGTAGVASADRGGSRGGHVSSAGHVGGGHVGVGGRASVSHGYVNHGWRGERGWGERGYIRGGYVGPAYGYGYGYGYDDGYIAPSLTVEPTYVRPYVHVAPRVVVRGGFRTGRRWR